MPPAPLELAKITGTELLRHLAAHGRSEHGIISSQYARELAADAPEVGALAVVACGRTVGAMSYGEIPLPNDGISGRIDVVVTDAACRGRGVGSLLIAGFVSDLLERRRERVRHLSVVAVHPQVASCVAALGFEAAAAGPNVPLYHARIGEEDRENVARKANRVMTRKLTELRAECARCKFRRTEPWCRARAREEP